MASCKGLFCFLVLALALACATSSRILDEEAVAPPEDTAPVVNAGPVGTAAGSVGNAGPVGTAAGSVGDVGTGGAVGGVGAGGAVGGIGTGGAGAGAGTGGVVGGVGTGGAAGGAGAAELTFFMHDILGGSNPTALAVTGLVTNPALGGQVPFAKPNGAVLPVNNGVPVNNANSGIINNNNIPFLTGLSGTTSNLVQQNGNGNSNGIIGGGFGFPALNLGQLGGGNALQKLMFGTMTVFDDELTEGHALSSGLVGKAQGFYIASSEDGTSQTMIFTVMFKSGSYEDSLSFFGVHKSVASESHLAIMGGTGKYVNAKGFALVKTHPPSLNQVQETDGMETVLEISVYLAY